MQKTNVLIIGGGPGGIIAAITARKNNPGKKILLLREKQKGVIPCGIPYIFCRLDSVEKNLMPDNPLDANKIDLLIGAAVKIDSKNKKILLKTKKEIAYEKLILATGSKPRIIPINGVNKKNVFVVEKDFDYLKKLREAIYKSKNIVIIGGGFIGVELADELSAIKKDINISIVERLGHCFGKSFDDDFSIAAEKILKEKGIKIYSNASVEEIGGRNKAEFVKINNKKILADIVILCAGAKPNIELAQTTDIKIHEKKGIWVDEYMRTNVPDIFAVGDCAQTKDFFTSQYLSIMLASTATTEARIAGANLYKLKLLRENKGTLGAFCTCVGDLVLASVGFNEKTANAQGFEIVVGIAEAPNHHPGTLPNTRQIKVKLIFSKSSGILLGGQVMGPETIIEMINILALAIQKNTTIFEFDTLQIATHPLLTAAPTVYPLINAAQSVLDKFMD
ncbi:MAG: pyridine nucleotide-disulfide oxidoreductase [Candidatus Aenigmarchaeota archaeon ex4484_52]|nr:MAG: pyridine nucleotide-disulfide oxidoreductase [Candidatus Aenigmarchaeota archaeon ex4484_52]